MDVFNTYTQITIYRVRNWALKFGVDLWEFGRQFTKMTEIRNVRTRYMVFVDFFFCVCESSLYLTLGLTLHSTIEIQRHGRRNRTQEWHIIVARTNIGSEKFHGL